MLIQNSLLLMLFFVCFFVFTMPDLMLDSLSDQETVWGLLLINGIVQMDKTIVRGPTVQLFCSVFVGSVFV